MTDAKLQPGLKAYVSISNQSRSFGMQIPKSVLKQDNDGGDAVFQPSVGKYANQDSKVLGMITEESAAYFNGKKSADAVAKSLANWINTYLNE